MDSTKCVVTHDKLYLSVGGKLQHVAKGSVITLDADRYAKLVDEKKVSYLDGKVVPETAADQVQVDIPKAPVLAVPVVPELPVPAVPELPVKAPASKKGSK